MEKFQTLYNLQTNAAVPNCDLDVLYVLSSYHSYAHKDCAKNINSIQHRKYTFDNSESTNPYFYMSPFGGLVVGNGAHLFIRTYSFYLKYSHANPTSPSPNVQPLHRLPRRHPRQRNPQILLRHHRSSRRHPNICPRLRAHPRKLVPPPPRRRQRIQRHLLRHRSHPNGLRRPRSSLSAAILAP